MGYHFFDKLTSYILSLYYHNLYKLFDKCYCMSLWYAIYLIHNLRFDKLGRYDYNLIIRYFTTYYIDIVRMTFNYWYLDQNCISDKFFYREILEQEQIEPNQIEKQETPTPQEQLEQVKSDTLDTSLSSLQEAAKSKTSEYFSGTTFANKIDGALQAIWSKENATQFMDKIDKLFFDLFSKEFSFLPDIVRQNLWASVGTALLAWIHNIPNQWESTKESPKWPTKSEAISWLFNTLTGVDVSKMSAQWGFNLIKQVLEIIWGFDLLKTQVTKISYMLDMIVQLKKIDKEKNLNLNRSESTINNPSKFVSILDTHDKQKLYDIKNAEDKGPMIALFFGQVTSVDLKKIGNDLWSNISDAAAQKMIQWMEHLHGSASKLMQSWDKNNEKFKWFYDMWKNILWQVEWLAQAFGMGEQETSWLRSILNRVFMIFTWKRFDTYEEEEQVAKFKIDAKLSASLEDARSDYLAIDPTTAMTWDTTTNIVLNKEILSGRDESKRNIISTIDKDRLTKSLQSHITTLDEKLVNDILWDSKTDNISQNIWLLIDHPWFWSKISSNKEISDRIQDAGSVVFALGVLLSKWDSFLEGMATWYIQIPAINPTSIDTNTEKQYPKTDNKKESSPEDKPVSIDTIKNKKLDALTGVESKLLFTHIFGEGVATEFLSKMDEDYGSSKGYIFLNILALAKHEWGFKFGPDYTNGDTNGQTAMGTFQISAKGGIKGVTQKYNSLLKEWIAYVKQHGIAINHDLSKYTPAQKDLLTFIAHTNYHKKIGWATANWKNMSEKLFDNTLDAKFMSDIQVGIPAIWNAVATQLKNNKVDDYA